MIRVEYPSFQFRRITDGTAAHCQRLREAIEAAAADDYCELLEELGEVEMLLTGAVEPRLSLAFVGQYNAGKSTIISALTGREDIPIDADVCTDTVTAYDWRGVRLLDTPGVQAGHPDHDEQTYLCLARADLLLFVITPELFDDAAGTYFRRLAFDEGKAAEMMMVVNKTSISPATPEVLRPDIERVTAPLQLEDLRTVFVDALAYLDAQSEGDPDDRAELLREANLETLASGIDQFVKEHGLMGRLTTPLHSLRSIAHRAAALTPAETAEDRARMLRLARALRELDHSEARLRSRLQALLSGAAAGIATAGNTLAQVLVEGATPKRVEQAGKEAEESVRQCAERLESAGIEAFAEAWQDLASRLEDITASDLSGALVPDLPEGAGYGIEVTAPDADEPAPAEVEPYVKAMQVAGDAMVNLAAGPRALDQAGKLIATSGSPAHTAVKSVGHFLGYKFKPWEAVKWANWLGKVGQVLSKAGPVLTVLATVLEEQMRKKHQRELSAQRSEVRAHFCQISAELAGRFTEWADALLSAAYGAYREFLVEEIRGAEDLRRESAETRTAIDEIIEQAGGLIREVTDEQADDEDGFLRAQTRTSDERGCRRARPG